MEMKRTIRIEDSNYPNVNQAIRAHATTARTLQGYERHSVFQWSGYAVHRLA